MNWTDPFANLRLPRGGSELRRGDDRRDGSPEPASVHALSAVAGAATPRALPVGQCYPDAAARLLYLVPDTGIKQRLSAARTQERPLDGSPLAIPPFLRHLHRLTGCFRHDGGLVPFIHAYARPALAGPASPLLFEPPAGYSDPGIASVGDAARAAILALQVYEWTRSATALTLARQWLRFVVTMQDPNGDFRHGLTDLQGTKQRQREPRAPAPGAAAGTDLALWALATAWRVTRDTRYLQCFQRAPLAYTDNLQALAVQALALMELYQVEADESLQTLICDHCARIRESGSEYFRDTAGEDAVALSGYYQLLAVARAGRLFSRLDFLRACESTVSAFVEPVVAQGFFHVYPHMPEPQCASDLAPLTLGLEELQRVARTSSYRALALRCIDWLYGNNPAGATVYDRNLGCCADGVHEGEVSPYRGAEAAAEAGFLELAYCRLHDGRGGFSV